MLSAHLTPPWRRAIKLSVSSGTAAKLSAAEYLSVPPPSEWRNGWLTLSHDNIPVLNEVCESQALLQCQLSPFNNSPPQQIAAIATTVAQFGHAGSLLNVCVAKVCTYSS